jgi:uncharacterized protein YjdB
MGRLRSLIILVPVLVVACDDQGPRTPADLVVTPNMPQVPMGGTRQLTATVVDADGRAIEGEAVTFESAEPDVVTVSDGGLLSSVGSLDTVTITATSGDLAAEVQAQVVPPPSSLVVSPSSLRLAVGEVVQLYIIVTDEHGDSIADAEFVLETDNLAVASVSVEGWVVGRRSGLATVYVLSGEHRRDVIVAVTP